MGKTKYATVASAASKPSGAQPGNVEAMPQVPKASAVQGSPRKKVNVRTPDADAHLCVYKVCSDAMIYKDDQGVCLFPGIDSVNQGVFVVTLSHPQAYPQIDFKFVEKMDAMLAATCKDTQRPQNWDALMQQLHIVHVNTGSFVPYQLPYRNWQRAFYIAGEASVCHNFLMEVDNCLVYTVEHCDFPKHGQFLFKVAMGVNVGFQVTKEDFDYPLVEITQDVHMKELAVSPLNVYPAQGVRPLIVHFEIVDDDNIAMTIFGDTFRHRRAFENAGLDSTKEEPAANVGESPSKSAQIDRPKRLETFYLMPCKDVSVASEAEFVTNLLTTVVENVIIDVRLISTGAVDTAAYKFVEALKETPNLFVHSI